MVFSLGIKHIEFVGKVLQPGALLNDLSVEIKPELFPTSALPAFHIIIIFVGIQCAAWLPINASSNVVGAEF